MPGPPIQKYQYVHLLISFGQTANYTIKIFMGNWNGLAIVGYGLAWTSL